MNKEPLTDRYQDLRNRMILARWSLSTSNDLIDHHVSDPMLKAILGNLCGCSGLPPNQLPDIIHAQVVNGFFDGGFYPRGGSFTIQRAFERALRREGGELRRNARVEKVMLEDKRAIGVCLEDGEETL